MDAVLIAEDIIDRSVRPLIEDAGIRLLKNTSEDVLGITVICRGRLPIQRAYPSWSDLACFLGNRSHL